MPMPARVSRLCADVAVRSSVSRSSAHAPFLAITVNPRPLQGTNRPFHHGTAREKTDFIPLRKKLKDEKKAQKQIKTGIGLRNTVQDARLSDWELTVGIEIHAQLNTDRKLFSRAATSLNDPPNRHASLFDLAFPGSQPEFQLPTLLPALRAAIALNCQIQRTSRFDRKHYFYHDQPAGYQITQFYSPFARDGSITLFDHDGIDPEDGRSITIGIKQIQMEQDTAKSQEEGGSVSLVDFNRVSQPLIEIISLPQLHHPSTAAAFVRKIQAILHAVDANTVGMEMGGLRADVNVSVKPNGTAGTLEYSGITGLGQRTEIKNLSSFKAVEDAIIAERDRQISVLEAGGVIEGETRGWSIGSVETRRLRGKEGEVDYRYMPDPDLGPLTISEDVLAYLQESMPMLPDVMTSQLVEAPLFNLTVKDAKTLVELDNGARWEFYRDVVNKVCSLQFTKSYTDQPGIVGRMVANWVLHELGGLLGVAEKPWASNPVSSQSLAEIVFYRLEEKITGSTAKALLQMTFAGDTRPIRDIVKEDRLLLRPISRDEYVKMAQGLLDANPGMVQQVREKRQTGKLMWFVGQMMRHGERGRIEAKKAEEVLREMLLQQR